MFISCFIWIVILIPCYVPPIEKIVRIFKKAIYEKNVKKSVFFHFEMSNEGLAVILAQNY